MESWSTFGSEVKTHSARKGPRCGISVLLDELPDDNARQAVRKALADSTLTSMSIYKALKARLGDQVPSHFTIANHRRGACRCEQ